MCNSFVFSHRSKSHKHKKSKKKKHKKEKKRKREKEREGETLEWERCIGKSTRSVTKNTPSFAIS